MFEIATPQWTEQIPSYFLKKLVGGSVFHVHVLLHQIDDRCLAYTITFILDEGLGEYFSLVRANRTEGGMLSIPTQVELLLMDLGCAPTWLWQFDGVLRYVCEFAKETNHKVVKDSGAYDFKPILERSRFV